MNFKNTLVTTTVLIILLVASYMIAAPVTSGPDEGDVYCTHNHVVYRIASSYMPCPLGNGGNTTLTIDKVARDFHHIYGALEAPTISTYTMSAEDIHIALTHGHSTNHIHTDSSNPLFGMHNEDHNHENNDNSRLAHDPSQDEDCLFGSQIKLY